MSSLPGRKAGICPMWGVRVGALILLWRSFFVDPLLDATASGNVASAIEEHEETPGTPTPDKAEDPVLGPDRSLRHWSQPPYMISYEVRGEQRVGNTSLWLEPYLGA